MRIGAVTFLLAFLVGCGDNNQIFPPPSAPAPAAIPTNQAVIPYNQWKEMETAALQVQSNASFSVRIDYGKSEDTVLARRNPADEWVALNFVNPVECIAEIKAKFGTPREAVVVVPNMIALDDSLDRKLQEVLLPSLEKIGCRKLHFQTIKNGYFIQAGEMRR